MQLLIYRRIDRPPLLDPKQKVMAVDLYQQKKHSVAEIFRTVGISKPTLYAYVRKATASEEK